MRVICTWEEDGKTAADLRSEIARLTVQPGPEQIGVRPYARGKPRRSKSVRTEAPPTTEIPPAVRESQAKAGEPTAVHPRYGLTGVGNYLPESLTGITLWECEGCHQVVSRLDHECIPDVGTIMPESVQPSPGSEMCEQIHTEAQPQCQPERFFETIDRLDEILADANTQVEVPAHPDTGLAVCRWEVGRWGI